jgi:hypothetical protein
VSEAPARHARHGSPGEERPSWQTRLGRFSFRSRRSNTAPQESRKLQALQEVHGERRRRSLPKLPREKPPPRRSEKRTAESGSDPSKPGRVALLDLPKKRRAIELRSCQSETKTAIFAPEIRSPLCLRHWRGSRTPRARSAPGGRVSRGNRVARTSGRKTLTRHPVARGVKPSPRASLFFGVQRAAEPKNRRARRSHRRPEAREFARWAPISARAECSACSRTARPRERFGAIAPAESFSGRSVTGAPMARPSRLSPPRAFGTKSSGSSRAPPTASPP